MLSVEQTLCTTNGDVDDICCDASNNNDDSSIDTIEHTENKDDVGVAKMDALPDKHDGSVLLDVVDAGGYGIFVSCCNCDVDDCGEDVGNSWDDIQGVLHGCEQTIDVIDIGDCATDVGDSVDECVVVDTDDDVTDVEDTDLSNTADHCDNV